MVTSARVSFTSVRRVAGNSCIVACQTLPLAASMKKSRKGTKVAATTTSYKELKRESSAARTGCESATETTCSPGGGPGSISETCSSKFASFCSMTEATWCKGLQIG